MDLNSWQIVSPWGMIVGSQESEFEDDAVYHAGRIDDMVRLPDDNLLIASRTSGVWIADESGGRAVPLMVNSIRPSIRTLCLGTQSDQHVFAGGEALWETDIRITPMDIHKWRRIPIRAATGEIAETGAILDITVTETGEVVVATENGVYFAAAATPSSPSYFWDQAFLSNRTRFSSVAASADSEYPWAAGVEVQRRIGGFASGLFVGRRGPNAVLLEQSAYLSTIAALDMSRVSIAACTDDRNVMYAVAGDSKGGISCILRSGKGGRSWQLAGNKVEGHEEKLFGGDSTEPAGQFLEHSGCIAVSTKRPRPGTPEKVVVGWQNGYFVSTNEGTSWKMVRCDDNRALHRNIHAIYFDSRDPDQRTLYICSDGGLAITKDLGKTHTTLCNRQLPNLQLLRAAPSRDLNGVSAVSLYNNGNSSCTIYPQSRPWRIVDGGNGRLVSSLEGGLLLSYTSDTVVGIRSQQFISSNETFKALSEFIPLSDSASRGLTLEDGLITANRPWWANIEEVWPLEAITTPTWQNATNEYLVAIAGGNGGVYGLFRGPTDRDIRWELLLTLNLGVGERIFSVASLDGTFILVGTDWSQIFKLTPNQFTWTIELMLVNGVVNRSQIKRFLILSGKLAFAVLSSAIILRLDDTSLSWSPLLDIPPPGARGRYTGIEADWSFRFSGSIRPIFVTSDEGVYTSADNGETWKSFALGLPRTPYCTDIRYAQEDSGAPFLYLATYGWSLYRVLLQVNPGEMRRVVLNAGSTFIMTEHLFGDNSNTMPFSAREMQVNVLQPVKITTVQHFFDGFEVIFTVKLQYFLDDSVKVSYTVRLINLDDQGFAEGSSSFLLLPFSDHSTDLNVRYGGNYGTAVFSMRNAM